MPNRENAGGGTPNSLLANRAAESFLRAIAEDAMLTLEDLGPLIVGTDGHQFAGEPSARTSEALDALAVGFSDSVSSLLGITDERIKKDLERTLRTQPLLEWCNALAAATDAASHARRESERQRLVPLGIRLAKVQRIDPMQILEMLVRSYAASLTMDSCHRE